MVYSSYVILLMQYNIIFSCIKIYKRPDAGSQLQPKHEAMNKLIKLLSPLIQPFKAYRLRDAPTV